MLKISFTVQSNVRYKNSNARLFRLYKRLFMFQCYFTALFNTNSTAIVSSDYHFKSKFKQHRIVIMRSPFHYKTSKTLLAQPKQQLTLSFLIKVKKKTPLFFSNDMQNLIKNLNTLNILVFKKIKICQQLVC